MIGVSQLYGFDKYTEMTRKQDASLSPLYGYDKGTTVMDKVEPVRETLLASGWKVGAVRGQPRAMGSRWR